MCYLIAKKFGEAGCFAVKTRHGEMLAEFTKSLQDKIGHNGVQLVTISRPNAYGEYEPYVILDNMETFEKKVLSM